MPTARKLPSGAWNCRVFVGMVDGKRKYKSVTVADPSRRGKKECERMASEIALSRRMPTTATVYDAVQAYIDGKRAVLSPSTIRSYERYRKRMESIQSTPADSLTTKTVQAWVNRLTASYSPKYIRNVYGLLTASLAYAGLDAPQVTFPSSAPKPLHTPSDAEIRALLDHISNNTPLRSACLLAAFGSLRRGEICALTPEDVDGCRIRVNKSMVQDADYSWHIKPMAKTDESNRTVVLPDFVVKEVALPIGLHPEQVSNRFRRAVRSSGLPHFRFHDLRHYYVSIAHALGVPDAYIMQMGGWKTDNVMHRVYRDTLPDVMQAEQDKLTKHFHDAFHDA